MKLKLVISTSPLINFNYNNEDYMVAQKNAFNIKWKEELRCMRNKICIWRKTRQDTHTHTN